MFDYLRALTDPGFVFLRYALAAGLLASVAFAADIVTVPTANQLKAGEIDVAAYYIGVHDLPDPLRPGTVEQLVRIKVEYPIAVRPGQR